MSVLAVAALIVSARAQAIEAPAPKGPPRAALVVIFRGSPEKLALLPSWRVTRVKVRPLAGSGGARHVLTGAVPLALAGSVQTALILSADVDNVLISDSITGKQTAKRIMAMLAGAKSFDGRGASNKEAPAVDAAAARAARALRGAVNITDD